MKLRRRVPLGHVGLAIGLGAGTFALSEPSKLVWALVAALAVFTATLVMVQSEW